MSAPAAYCRPLAVREFRRGLTQLSSLRGLIESVSAIALHERPDLAGESIIDQLDEWAAEVRGRARSGQPAALLAHLHHLMFDELEFHGNTSDYYSPNNSYPQLVVRDRRGIPITLALVYAYLAEQIGLTVYGVNAPGHFLAAIRMSEAGQQKLMFVDPFYGGKLLNLPEVFERISQAVGRRVEPTASMLAPATNAVWLARVLLNLQAAFAQAARERDVYAMQELQALLDAEQIE